KNSTIDDIEQVLLAHYGPLNAAGNVQACQQLWEHLRYIGNHKKRMRYVSLRNAGLPVGSGVTESTAKTVVGHRAKRSGQHWGEGGWVRLHCGDVKRRILRGFPDFSREASGSSVEWHEALPACLTWRALGERSPEESV